MGEAAVNVAKACNYSGAGTVEFLLSENMEFYFLEMNTRLQVEHPVTELITGIDLVKEQIRVAAGETLSFSQGDLKIHGHAIELRICAEDPMNQFLPNVGTVETYKVPQGSGIRVDDCMESGMEIPIYYDNMLAKLIVWAPNRLDAIARMRRAISEYVITGIETTLMFGDFVMTHPAFIEGKFDTHFIQQYFTPEAMLLPVLNEQEQALLGVAALEFFQSEKSHVGSSDGNASVGGGALASDWYLNRKNYS
jgi:acetyl/propionyl-CoA carboxylase alpha subunit